MFILILKSHSFHINQNTQMKKILLSISIVVLTFLGCKNPETVKPISSPKVVMTTISGIEVPIPITPINQTAISGKIYLDGVPLLKKTESNNGDIAEYFYNEKKQLIKIQFSGENVWATEQIFSYSPQGLLIQVNFVANPNFVVRTSFGRPVNSPIVYEYDKQQKLSARYTQLSKQTYEYDERGRPVKEFSLSLTTTTPSQTLAGTYKYDDKNNRIEFLQSDQINKYTFDDKLNPFPDSYSQHRGKNNLLTSKTTGGWFGDDSENYQYSYNKFDLPTERSDAKGNVLKFSYYE
jgi:YD repeat-containing protein